ncbi:MAG: glycosyltransferase family 39 protein [Deltaproteobacteria bacterium]|nr:glycosyltransferase family 39 protein [Deltaproteobacteria bacterium]
MRRDRELTIRDHAVGAALMLIYLALLIATAPDLGMSRDESFYAIAAESYAEWFDALVCGRDEAFYKEFIDRVWRVNHEHPPLFKSLFSFSYLAHRAWGVFSHDSLSYRFFGMLSAGLLLWLIYIFGARSIGRSAGLFASLGFALMPRLFYHAHLAAFDVPIALMTTLVIYAYWRALTSLAWTLLLGVIFGMALATKHNSWVLPAIFAIHFSWVTVVELRARKNGEGKSLGLVPYWLISMLFIGPAIFIGSWPWLWTDTWPRIVEYVAFHAHHVYYNMAYFGVNYFRPPFPISYPWVMTLFTVPLATLMLCVAGLALKLRPLLSYLFARKRAFSVRDATGDPRQTTLLFIGSMLAPLVLIALPSTPIFGGTKHWLTAYPFVALFAGVGFDRVSEALANRLPKKNALAAPLICLALLLAPAVVETEHSHPFALSHYGFAAGFVPGSADLGMNRQYWGYTTGSLVDFFNRRLHPGESVWLCDTTYKAWQMLSRDGRLKHTIRAAPDIATADYAMVHHEQHFAEVDFQIWTVYGTVQPVYVLTYDGVPIISVYENPKPRGRRSKTR